jgi:hypothetical protein
VISTTHPPFQDKIPFNIADKQFFAIFLKNDILSQLAWPYRLTARTTGFQSVNQGSIPCRVTNFSEPWYNSSMYKSISLIVFGLIVFFLTGGFYSDFGWIGAFCVLVGVVGIFSPQVSETFLKVKTHSNKNALILLVIVLIPALIYIWYKLH